MSAHEEIERKFLICYPDTAQLARQPGALCADILQTYLRTAPGCERRVRSRTDGDGTVYTRTEKWNISNLRRGEDEVTLTAAQYTAMLDLADPSLRPVRKTRYRIPFGGHFLEIDLYPFWSDRAILEVELTGEEEPVAVPSYLTVLREVTNDPRYRNRALAAAVPQDSLPE